jgi:hypothetical protein
MRAAPHQPVYPFTSTLPLSHIHIHTHIHTHTHTLTHTHIHTHIRGKPPSPEAQRAKMVALGLTDFQLAFYTRALPVLLQKLDLLPPE